MRSAEWCDSSWVSWPRTFGPGLSRSVMRRSTLHRLEPRLVVTWEARSEATQFDWAPVTVPTLVDRRALLLAGCATLLGLHALLSPDSWRDTHRSEGDTARAVSSGVCARAVQHVRSLHESIWSLSPPPPIELRRGFCGARTWRRSGRTHSRECHVASDHSRAAHWRLCEPPELTRRFTVDPWPEWSAGRDHTRRKTLELRPISVRTQWSGRPPSTHRPHDPLDFVCAHKAPSARSCD